MVLLPDIAGIWGLHCRVDAPLDLLPFNFALPVLLIDPLRPLHELVVAVQARRRRRKQTDEPRLVGLFLEVFRVHARITRQHATHQSNYLVRYLACDLFNSPLLNPRRIKHGQHVERHVARITQLAQDLQVLDDLVAAIAGFGGGVVELAGGFEVLDELADAHYLPREAELCFSRQRGDASAEVRVGEES